MPEAGALDIEEVADAVAAAGARAFEIADSEGLDEVTACIVSADGVVTSTNPRDPGSLRRRKGLSSIPALLGGQSDSENATQDSSKLTKLNDAQDFSLDNIVPAPWNYMALYQALVTNPTHAACVESKASDYVAYGWELSRSAATDALIEEDASFADVVAEAEEEARMFLATCADGDPVTELCKEVGVDYECAGTGYIEGRRTRMGLIGKLTAVSPKNVRVTQRIKKKGVEPAQPDFLQKRFNENRYFVYLGRNVKYVEGFDPATTPPREFPKTRADREAALMWNQDQLISPTTGRKTNSANWMDYATELLMVPRLPYTNSEIYGTPAGIQAVGAMMAQSNINTYNAEFFGNKGVPQFAVIFKNLNSRQPMGVVEGDAAETNAGVATRLREVVREYFLEQLASGSRSVMVLTLTGETEVVFERLTSDVAEASFKGYEARATEQIRMAHQVPGPAIGLLEAANLGSGRDSLQMRRYNDHVVKPGNKLFSSVINMILRNGLLIPWFDFKFLPMEVEDVEARREYALKSLIAGGMSLNMYLREIGKPTLPAETGADTFYIRSGNVTAVNEDIENAAAAFRLSSKKANALQQGIADLVASSMDEKPTV